MTMRLTIKLNLVLAFAAVLVLSRGRAIGTAPRHRREAEWPRGSGRCSRSGQSEQMSATSQELAAQAEQLQASIAYFRTGEHRHAPPPPAVVMRAAKPTAASRVASSPRRKANGHAVPDSHGVTLDLSRASVDEHDRDFVHY
jgi:hypothetical protein